MLLFFAPKIQPMSKMYIECIPKMCYNRVVKANDKEKNYVLFTTKGGAIRRFDYGGIYAFGRESS